MTRKEMMEGFKELGGVNERNAIVLTIRKYKGLPSHWKDLRKRGKKSPHFLGASTCPLCECFPWDRLSCPLKNCNRNSRWHRIRSAILKGNYNLFRKRCTALVRFLEKALKKLDKGVKA